MNQLLKLLSSSAAVVVGSIGGCCPSQPENKDGKVELRQGSWARAFHGGGQQVAGMSDVSGQTDRPHDTSKPRLTLMETPRNFSASTNSYPRLQAAALKEHSQSQG